MLYTACAHGRRRAERRRKQASVILIACLPPGYGSEIEPRKNVAVKIQCNRTVLILSGTERVKLLFFATTVAE